MRRAVRIASILALATSICRPTQAKEGELVLHIGDVQHKSVENVVVVTEGDGSRSAPTDRDGKTRLTLAPGTHPGQWVSLQIADDKWVFISPWDRRALVPPFENESENYVPVIVGQRANRELLESPDAIKAIAASFLARQNPIPGQPEITAEQRQQVLAEQAARFGLAPADVDTAIRAWTARTQDLNDQGLAALYQQKYPQATAKLTQSLAAREKQPKADPKAVADTAAFLGQSLYRQGHYEEAIGPFRRAVAIDPTDIEHLNWLGLALLNAGKYPEAEDTLTQSLTLAEKTLGPEDPDVAKRLNNLAEVYDKQGAHAKAEPLLQRALAIVEKALGPEHPAVAIALSNLAELYDAQGAYAKAEPLLQRALAIDEKALGPEHPRTATCLNNLALLYDTQGAYAKAEPLLQRALAIDEKALGPEHPSVATALSNLASLYKAQGAYAKAEPLLQRALAIDEKTLGGKHPITLKIKNNYADVLRKLGRDEEAKALEVGNARE